MFHRNHLWWRATLNSNHVFNTKLIRFQVSHLLTMYIKINKWVLKVVLNWFVSFLSLLWNHDGCWRRVRIPRMLAHSKHVSLRRVYLVIGQLCVIHNCILCSVSTIFRMFSWTFFWVKIWLISFGLLWKKVASLWTLLPTPLLVHCNF